MATKLQELAELVEAAKRKRTALEEVSAHQVQLPPMLNEGQSKIGMLLGQGTPEQSKQLLQMLSEPRGPRESRMDAFSRGLLKSEALREKQLQAKHASKIEAAKLAAQGAQDHLANSTGLYNLQKEEEATAYKKQRDEITDRQNAGKRGTVSFNGQVWQTDANGNPIRPLGMTEGGMNRAAEALHKEITRQEEARQAMLAQLSKAEQAAANAQGVMENVADVRARAENTTPGMVSAVSGWVPGTDAYAYRKSIDSLRAKLGSAKLQELRAAAESGASGFGNLTEKELDRLETSIAAIDAGMDKHDLERNLKIIEKYFGKAVQAYSNLQALQATQQGSVGVLSPTAQKYVIQPTGDQP